MLRKTLAISLMMSAASLAAADTLDVALSDTTAHFKYGVASSVTSKSEFYAELTYNDASSLMGGLGLLVANDESGVPGLTIGVGGKVVAATLKEPSGRKNTSAAALGAQVRYELPAERRVAFAGEFYFAPKIITYGDANRFQQFGARAEFSISPQMQVYGGYRKVLFGLNSIGADAVLISGPHLGVQLSF